VPNAFFHFSCAERILIKKTIIVRMSLTDSDAEPFYDSDEYEVGESINPSDPLFNVNFNMDDPNAVQHMVLHCLEQRNPECTLLHLCNRYHEHTLGITSEGKKIAWAAMFHGLKNVRRCVEDHGIDVDSKGDKGFTALICASRSGRLDVVKYLIDKGANVNIQDEEGSTALIWASSPQFREDDHIEIVKTLLENGADLTIKCKKKKNAKQWAKYCGFHDIAKVLEDVSSVLCIYFLDSIGFQTILRSSALK